MVVFPSMIMTVCYCTVDQTEECLQYDMHVDSYRSNGYTDRNRARDGKENVTLRDMYT